MLSRRLKEMYYRYCALALRVSDALTKSDEGVLPAYVIDEA